MGGRAWWATAHGVTKGIQLKQLSTRLLLTNVSQNDPNNLDYFAFHNITGKLERQMFWWDNSHPRNNSGTQVQAPLQWVRPPLMGDRHPRQPEGMKQGPHTRAPEEACSTSSRRLCYS